jgi:hypothetical protein
MFFKGDMKRIHWLQLKFIIEVNMGLTNVCLILGSLKKSLSIIYVISIICYTYGLRGFWYYSVPILRSLELKFGGHSYVSTSHLSTN